MGGGTRRVALITMIASVALLLLTLWFRPAGGVDQSASDPSEPGATSVPTPNPFAVSASDGSIMISRLSSPAPLVARAQGTISGSTMVVAVIANGRALPQVTLDADADGNFTIDIGGLEPGPQEICLDDACQRVLVAETSTEDPAVIQARIEQAIASARARLDLGVLIPGWTFVIGGPNTSAGGSADRQAKTITINATSGRSLTEYEVTVLHEIGHAIDATWMTEADRDEFRSLRNLDPALPWGTVAPLATGDDRWRDAGEDFAEIFVAFVLGANYPIATNSIAAQPSADDLRIFCALVAADSLDCG